MTDQQGSATYGFRPFVQIATLARDPVMATLQIRSTVDPRVPTSFCLDALRLTVGCIP
jgi:hypothetical protein